MNEDFVEFFEYFMQLERFFDSFFTQNAHINQFGLNLCAIKILHSVWFEKLTTPTEIEKRYKVSHGAVNAAIKKLKGHNLVCYNKGTTITLTPDGESAIKNIHLDMYNYYVKATDSKFANRPDKRGYNISHFLTYFRRAMPCLSLKNTKNNK
ncbi:MAG: hypothetical protein IJQ90_04075 [Alphaproteobacteria bacterium]|nr:hypothetical protein [Alphaproteobacteria bacterium]